MATTTLTLSNQSKDNVDNATFTYSASTINNHAAANIPANSTINSVTLKFTAYKKSSAFFADVLVRVAGTQIWKSESGVKYADGGTAHSVALKSYCNSTTGKINGDLVIYMAERSSLDTNHYYEAKNVSIVWDYTPKYTVTLDANGGTVSPTSVLISSGSGYGTLPTPTRTGYTFNYWTKDGTRIYSTTAVTSSHTLKANWTINQYTITANYSSGSGTVTGGGTYNYGTEVTLTATPNSGYKFVKWSDGNTSNPRTITVTGDATYTAVFEKSTCTVTFRNADGSVVKSSSVQAGSTLGTLPSVSRDGYTFGGWIPCEPAKKTDGTVLDSYQYSGDSSSTHALDKKYKYTDKLSVHIEAYMDNWEDIASLKSQIISCTEGGGWGLGYQANTTGHGCELYAGGYKGIDIGFGTAGVLTNKTWYAFDIVFSGGTFEVYVNGTKKGTQTTSSTAISYNADNTIFVGAEAAKSTTTPGGNYFKGYISNVFIANKGTRLAIATTSTVVEGNVDYYPVWRLKPTYTITASGENGSVSGGGAYEEGKTATLTATPNAGYKFKQWSDGNKSNPRTVTVTGNATYTAVFEKSAPEFKTIAIIRSSDLAKVTINTPVDAGAKFIISVEVT